MAGSGWRDWTTGEVVTEANFQGKIQDQVTMFFVSAAARDAAVTAPWEGARCYLADVDTFQMYTGSAWLPDSFQTLRKNSAGTVFQRKRLNLIEGGNVTITVADDSGNDEVDITFTASGGASTGVVKSADESVSSASTGTTLQNDDELLISLLANTDYSFDAFIMVVSATAPDFKFAFTVPAGASLAWSSFDLGVVGGSTTLAPQPLVTASGTAVTLTVGDSSQFGVWVKGSVRVAATAGNLQLQWAQGNSSATNTTVKAGSTLNAVVGT